MLPDILPEVRIKLTKGSSGDNVIIIENIPKDMLYTKTRKMVPRLDRDGELTGELKPGMEFQEVLREKLEMGGDGFIHFEIRNPGVQLIYRSIMNYVEKSLPRGELIPKPVKYSSMPGHPMANPIGLEQVPRVVLPVSSPPSVQKTVEVGAPPVLTVPLPKVVVKKPLSQERLAQMRESMAIARASKKDVQKQEQK